LAHTTIGIFYCESQQSMQSVEVLDPLPAPVIECVNLDLDQVTFAWSAIPGATGYDIVVISGPSGIQSGTSYTVTGLNEGDEVTIQVTALGGPPCGNSAPSTQTCQAQSCPGLAIIPTLPTTDFCFNDGSDPIPLTVDTLNAAGGGDLGWSGSGVFENAGEFFFDQQAAGLGVHTLTVVYQEGGCSVDTTIDLTVNAIPEVAILDLDSLDFGIVCEGEPIVIFYEGTADGTGIFDWDFGGADQVNPQVDFETYELVFNTAGLYEINLTVTQDGCTEVSVPYSVFVSAPIGSVDLSCEVLDLTSINFSWTANPEAIAYELNLNGSVIDTVTDLSYLADSLVPQTTVTLIVTPLSPDHPCGNGTPASVSCMTDPCPDLMSDLSANLQEVCINDQPIELMVEILNGSFIDSSVIWGGDGVVGNFFLPDSAGLGLHTITMDYVEFGPCPIKDSFDILVLPLPDPSFTLDPLEVCVGETVNVEYTGGADASATYNWDFGAATVLSGSGQGPFEISYDTPGTQEVSLFVIENGCVGPTDTLTVDIVAPLAAPVISCINPGLEEVTFSWDPIAGAIGYEITVVSSGATSTQTGTTFTVTGLNPGETVSIQVQALGDPPCGNGDPVEASCTTLPCPDISVSSITPAQSFCFSDN
ncbi:MAG: hypothetical protein AAFN65_09530, partial [Bacteroidota bacterium]